MDLPNSGFVTIINYASETGAGVNPFGFAILTEDLHPLLTESGLVIQYEH